MGEIQVHERGAEFRRKHLDTIAGALTSTEPRQREVEEGKAASGAEVAEHVPFLLGDGSG